MKDDTFENLEVWRDGVGLATKVYNAMRTCRDFHFRGQIQDAAVSISSNIAEGYERDTNVEFIRFLTIAKGSCGEVRSQAYIARQVQLLPNEKAEEIIADAKLLSKRLARFIAVRRSDFS